jgi:hypothetical protein
MFPTLLTSAGMKRAGSFASHVIAHATASMIGNALVETLKIRFIAVILRALKQKTPATSEGCPLDSIRILADGYCQKYQPIYKRLTSS